MISMFSSSRTELVQAILYCILSQTNNECNRLATVFKIPKNAAHRSAVS
jgi:hypothetical protein